MNTYKLCTTSFSVFVSSIETKLKDFEWISSEVICIHYQIKGHIRCKNTQETNSNTRESPAINSFRNIPANSNRSCTFYVFSFTSQLYPFIWLIQHILGKHFARMHVAHFKYSLEETCCLSGVILY